MRSCKLSNACPVSLHQVGAVRRLVLTALSIISAFFLTAIALTEIGLYPSSPTQTLSSLRLGTDVQVIR